MKRIALVPHGPFLCDGQLVLVDTDHDSLGEFIYRGGRPTRLDVVEYRSVNSYVLVQSDTGAYPPPPGGVLLGNFCPFDVGDVDRDGLADLAGQAYYTDSSGALRFAICTIESRTPNSYPDTINWYYRLPGTPGGFTRSVPYADMDGDQRREILQACWGTWIFENVADNKESLVFAEPPGGPMTYGDYDLNGKMDLATTWAAQERICECVGDNRLAEVCSLWTGRGNPNDFFSGEDVDQNGWPEFFVAYDHYGSDVWLLMLLMFEAVAEHEYVFYPVDSIRLGSTTDRASVCADFDGDGVQEVAWSLGEYVIVLSAVGPHEFERVFVWRNDHGPNITSLCNASDFNRNGYDELYVGGDHKTSVFEVEAIWVMLPNGGEYQAGDTCRIRWQVLTPPRCDSVSLFLLTDTVVPEGEWFWHMDTIVTGLAPGDTAYPWVVPDTVLDAAWIVAIAYGPGWQFDRSDSAFSIHPVGVSERTKPVAQGPLPEPTIVGDVLVWSATTPSLRNVGDIALQSGAMLLDATGRAVMDLQPGPNDVRHAAPGVYFVVTPHPDPLPQGERGTAVRKIVIQH
ncbi:MAG: VCBS repeat-containing protein [candidate division WOR-3 bacterium]|nr:MAG: VCBS repeat-containing protein [candidate division WOR-3 bacterium]